MHIPDAVRTLEHDLREVFGGRLLSLVAYRGGSGAERAATPTLAIVDALSAGDLRACAERVAEWHDAGLATPLLLAGHEFGRSLDAFPFEFGAILAEHAVVAGADPFAALKVDPAHLRHACEIQARSHLLHLREGFLETRGRGDLIAALIVRSAAPLAALLRSVARLRDHEATGDEVAFRVVEAAAGAPAGSLTNVASLAGGATLTPDAARRLFPPYLDAVERLTHYIDRWSDV